MSARAEGQFWAQFAPADEGETRCQLLQVAPTRRTNRIRQVPQVASTWGTSATGARRSGRPDMSVQMQVRWTRVLDRPVCPDVGSLNRSGDALRIHELAVLQFRR
jgi:hypothetical protein